MERNVVLLDYDIHLFRATAFTSVISCYQKRRFFCDTLPWRSVSFYFPRSELYLSETLNAGCFTGCGGSRRKGRVWKQKGEFWSDVLCSHERRRNVIKAHQASLPVVPPLRSLFPEKVTHLINRLRQETKREVIVMLMETNIWLRRYYTGWVHLCDELIAFNRLFSFTRAWLFISTMPAINQSALPVPVEDYRRLHRCIIDTGLNHGRLAFRVRTDAVN